MSCIIISYLRYGKKGEGKNLLFYNIYEHFFSFVKFYCVVFIDNLVYETKFKLEKKTYI